MMGFHLNKSPQKLLSLISQKNVSNVYLANKTLPTTLQGTLLSYQTMQHQQTIQTSHLMTYALARLNNHDKLNDMNNLNKSEYSTEASNEPEISHLKKKKPIEPNGKPTLEQLLLVEEIIKTHLPKFLKETHPYGAYINEVVFENLYNEEPKITVGALNYAIELTKLRFKINVKFTNAIIQILKITHDENEGTVKIRWRLRGLRAMKIFTPWKIKIWNLKESFKTEAEWHDGFSILYVRGDGRITKHTMQRVIANQDETETTEKNKLIKKLATNVSVGAS